MRVRALFLFLQLIQQSFGIQTKVQGISCVSMLNFEIQEPDNFETIRIKSNTLNSLRVNLNDASIKQAVLHFIHWSQLSLGNSYGSQDSKLALLFLRAEIHDILSRPIVDESDLLNTLSKVKAYSLFNTPVFRSWSEEDKTFFFQLFRNSEFHRSLIQVGKIKDNITRFDETEIVVSSLALLVPILKEYPSGLANIILADFGEQVSASFFSLPKDAINHSPRTTWNSSRSVQIAKGYAVFLAKNKEVHTHRIEKEFPELDPQLKNDFAENLSAFSNSRSMEIVRKVTRQEWYRKQPVAEQSKVFFLLNYLGYLSETSESPHTKRVLSNTLEYLLKNNIPIYLKEMTALGTAGSGEINLQSAKMHLFGTSYIHVDAKNMAIEVLPHEVSHLISGQGVEASVRYFEEEYRAWQVGLAAKLGRLPTKEEQFKIVVNLLTNAAGSDAYSYIASAWKAKPDSFYPYLKAFEFGDPQILIGMNADQMRLFGSRAPNKEQVSPTFGWDGFIYNEVKK